MLETTPGLPLKNIVQAVEAWHSSPDERPLYVYLGMSEFEYARWVERRMRRQELAALGYYES